MAKETNRTNYKYTGGASRRSHFFPNEMLEDLDSLAVASGRSKTDIVQAGVKAELRRIGAELRRAEKKPQAFG